MTNRYAPQEKRRRVAISMLRIYGIDANRVPQDSICEDGYGYMLDGEELLALPPGDAAKVITGSGYFRTQQRTWPEGFPVRMFMELYNAIVR